MLDKINNPNLLPIEIVNEIADYHNYEKYCKPDHKKNFNYVLFDIIRMGEIMNPISAKLAKECWGSNAFNNFDESTFDFSFPISEGVYSYS